MANNSSSNVPWLRLTIEAIAIVASILAAFAIDAWWQGQLEEDEAHEILVSLKDEFEGHRAALLEKEVDWTERGASMERLLHAIQTGETPPPAVMDTLLDDISYPGTWDPGSGARDALIASGRLELIDNLELRNRLSAWQGRVDEVRDNEQGAREMVLNIINPFLAERIPMDRLLATTDGSWPVDFTSDAEAAPAYRALIADPVFKNYAAIRYVWLNLGEYRKAIVFADSILMAIDAELRQ
jgi:hypothetical protein